MKAIAVPFLGLLILAPHGAGAQARWDESLFNPKPATGDLILPMPCNGAMAFRPVEVIDRGGPLDDTKVELGTADTEFGFNEFYLETFLAAPFPAADGKRLYLMGKYEVTRDQYAAVSGQCSNPSPEGREAQSEVSWSEAVQFADRWTAWLLQNARETLPRRGKAYGFVRLPTEDEWEYAARGGAALSDSDRSARTFPMPEGIDRYAVAGSRASEGRPQPVGQLLPNPLGLYDVLGNVAEWVLDPYRPRHPDRSHGMVGGQVARGGSYTTTLSELRSAMRDEIPPFDISRSTPTRLRFVGFRVVLASPVGGGDLASVEALRKAFDALPRTSGEANASREALANLKKQTADNAQLRAELDRLSARLTAEDAARTDAARRLLQADVHAAAALAYTVWRLGGVITAQQNTLHDMEKMDSKQNPEAARGGNLYHKMQEAIALNRGDRAASLDAYAMVLRRAVTGVPRKEVDSVLQVVGREYQARSDRRLALMAVISTHLTSLAEGHPIPPDKMLGDIGAFQRGK
jgi:formylglycine-generating enzyme required for sulfatase activity